MILGLLAAMAHDGTGLERPDPVLRLERIDLFAEEPGHWMLDELPRAGVAPRAAALRWVQQVRFGIDIPRSSLVIGLAVQSQSIAVRRPLIKRGPVYAQGGVSTALGLPRGAFVGLEAWAGPVRFGLALNAQSEATWARPRWDYWRVLPGVGIGLGRSPFRHALGGRIAP